MNNKEKNQTAFITLVAIATFFIAIIGSTVAYFSLTITGNDTASSIFVDTGVLGSIQFTDSSSDNVTLGSVNLQDSLSWESLDDTSNPTTPNNVLTKNFSVTMNASSGITNAATYSVYLVTTGADSAPRVSSSTKFTTAAANWFVYKLTCTSSGGSGTSTPASVTTETTVASKVNSSAVTIDGTSYAAGKAFLLGSGTFNAGSYGITHSCTLKIGVLNLPKSTESTSGANNQNTIQGASYEGKIQIAI